MRVGGSSRPDSVASSLRSSTAPSESRPAVVSGASALTSAPRIVLMAPSTCRGTLICVLEACLQRQ